MGGNLGRDGDVEVAQAQALPVEAVEPPAISYNIRPCSHFEEKGTKNGTQRKMVQCLSRHILCALALSLRGMAERTAARFVNDELAQEIGSRHHPDN